MFNNMMQQLKGGAGSATSFPLSIVNGRRFRSLFIIGILTLGSLLFFRAEVLNAVDTVTPKWKAIGETPQASTPSSPARREHPIDHLIHNASRHFHELLAKRSFTVHEAASRYRERRGRHPPPGFDAWFAQAEQDDAIIVEEFFDRIHHDLNPFWALDPREMRTRATVQPQVVRVRNGSARFDTDDPGRQPWIQLWTALVEEMMPHLPDLDMAVNVMDETRLLVPWETMDGYVKAEQQGRRIIDPKEAISTYSGLGDLDGTALEPYNPKWLGDAPKYWDHLRLACAPDSPARNVTALESFNVPIEWPNDPMPYTYKGFVQNFTQAQDPCLQPHLRGMHGTFIESVSMATLHEIPFPMFGGSKLPQNNEILIPGAMYLSGREFYNGGSDHGPEWSQKKDGLIWRGTASGGRNKEDTWWHFHRHRWVQMMNGTTVAAVEAGDAARGPSFSLSVQDRYSIPAQMDGDLGGWVSSFADVAFVNLECFPEVSPKDAKQGKCFYTAPFMAVQPSKPMKQQYKYKYLPDVDGNSFSARWRAFLQSTSMPLKATIYAEWHDDRIVPWLHFVPFDMSYVDIYAVMDYFLNGHDKEAEMIATEGSDWAAKVYRREDMKLYVWRLLLEYARVVDDKRDYLAFVEDL